MQKQNSKKKFLEKLYISLSFYFGDDDCDSIIKDYEEWFENEEMAEKSEHEICSGLGKPFDIARNLYKDSKADYLEPGQVEPALSEIAGQLLTGGGADPQAARDAVLHTMACKAAVKGGQRNTREELLVVVREVMAGRVKYCPHGRPVAITMTRSQLERQFKRSS